MHLDKLSMGHLELVNAYGLHYEQQITCWMEAVDDDSDLYNTHSVSVANVLLVQSVLGPLCRKKDMEILKSQAASEWVMY